MEEVVKKKKSKINKNSVMAFSFGVLNLADYLTTRRILNTGGEELNPIVNFLIRNKCFGIFKTISTLAGMAAIYGEDKPRIADKALLGFYTFIVGNNIKEIVLHETKRQFVKAHYCEMDQFCKKGK